MATQTTQTTQTTDITTLTNNVAEELWNPAVEHQMAINEVVRQVRALMSRLSRADQQAAEAELKNLMTQEFKRNKEKRSKKEKKRSKKEKKRSRSPSTPKNKAIVSEEPGAPKKARIVTCGKCKQTGHTARSKKCSLYEDEAKPKAVIIVQPMGIFNEANSSSSSSDSSGSESDEGEKGEKRVSPTRSTVEPMEVDSSSDSDTVPSDSE
jgi:uncharacterized coiled-coil protein SlyX